MWTCSVTLLLTLTPFAAAAVNCSDSPDYQKIPKRYLSEKGLLKNISLYWGSETSRAASALLAEILHRYLGYQNVHLVEGPQDLRTLAITVEHNVYRIYNERILAIGTTWVPATAPKCTLSNGSLSNIAGPRLEEFGAGSVPVQRQMQVFLAKQYKNDDRCKYRTQWNFYKDVDTLKYCGFRVSDTDTVIVYGLDSAETIVENLKTCAEVPHLQYKDLERSALFEMIDANIQSVLFVDYNMWSSDDDKDVKVIQPPTCNTTAIYGYQEYLDTAISMRAGDVTLFQEHAPQLIQFVYDFTPKPHMIRDILTKKPTQRQSFYKTDIEHAACEWASNNIMEVDSWQKEFNNDEKAYIILLFICDSHDKDKYFNIASKLITNTIPKLFPQFKVDVTLYTNCTDHFLSAKLELHMRYLFRSRIIGVLLDGKENITDDIKSVSHLDFLIFLYNSPEAELDSVSNVKLTSGRTLHMAVALRYFMYAMNWTRIGIISDPTSAAKRLVTDLKALDGINASRFGDHSMQSIQITEWDAEKILKKLVDENARIILVNTNYENAVTILLAGLKLKMNSSKYAWIVRDWEPNNRTSDIQHFTISFSCFCDKDIPSSSSNNILRNEITTILGNCNETENWPPRGTALADAMLKMIHGFDYIRRENAEFSNDMRTKEVTEIFGIKLINPFQGITQIYTFTEKSNYLEEVMMFVDKWNGDERKHLASWRVNTNNVTEISGLKISEYFQGNTPHDGSTECYISNGDLYSATCYDIVCLSVLILAIPFTMFAYRSIRRYLKEQQKRLLYELLAKRKELTAALSADYLVDRSALTVVKEIGAGRFGRVYLGVLRAPQCRPRYVAIKMLYDQESETEILHEACLLASLKHDLIVRLVGVCIDKESPLVLMEVAFFGDLLHYLQDRRYLIENTENQSIESENCDEETLHVSAEALTRLARQAASALGYLALRGIIHRDLRAANCLVDGRRSLKLADFGLARATLSSNSNGSEYACRRRGLLPVVWMAPESLISGVFSAASDIWALGLLIIELITLGERPFGTMSPYQVMQYVGSGGKPIIPRDATSQTKGLLQLCWKREPEQRPTAAQVVAYLADRPYALHPTLDRGYLDEYNILAPIDSNSSYFTHF